MTGGPQSKFLWLQRIAVALGLSGIVAGPFVLAFVSNAHVGWATIVAGLIFLITSRFDEITEIGFGSFKAKLERKVEDVETTMEAVRRAAVLNAQVSLDLVQMSGRMGGMSDRQKQDHLDATRSLLADLGVSDPEATLTKSAYHDAVEFDYASWATGDREFRRIFRERRKLNGKSFVLEGSLAVPVRMSLRSSLHVPTC